MGCNRNAFDDDDFDPAPMAAIDNPFDILDGHIAGVDDAPNFDDINVPDNGYDQENEAPAEDIAVAVTEDANEY
jgi:hypothetical protein